MKTTDAHYRILKREMKKILDRFLTQCNPDRTWDWYINKEFVRLQKILPERLLTSLGDYTSGIRDGLKGGAWWNP